MQRANCYFLFCISAFLKIYVCFQVSLRYELNKTKTFARGMSLGLGGMMCRRSCLSYYAGVFFWWEFDLIRKMGYRRVLLRLCSLQEKIRRFVVRYFQFENFLIIFLENKRIEEWKAFGLDFCYTDEINFHVWRKIFSSISNRRVPTRLQSTIWLQKYTKKPDLFL